MASEWDALYKALADPTRRRIIELLYTRGPTGYTEIMTTLGINNTGKLNYHLKTLGKLIQKDDQGRYSLSEAGTHAASLLKSLSRGGVDDASIRSYDPSEGSTSLLRTVGGVALIIIGAMLLLIAIGGAVALPIFLSTQAASGAAASAQSGPFTLNPHTTRIMSFSIIDRPAHGNITWAASAPVGVYLLNQSQYISLYSQGSPTQGLILNATPSGWIEERLGARGNLSFNLNGQSPVFIGVSSNTSAYVESLKVVYTTVSQQSHHPVVSPVPVIILVILAVLGSLIVYIGARLIRNPR